MLSSRLPEPSFAPEQVLDCLGAIALGIHQTLSLDNILNTVVQEAHKLLQTDRVLIYRFQPDASGVVVAESVGSNWTSALSQTIHDPCFTMTWDQAYRQGHFSAIADIYTSDIQPCYLELLSQFQVQATLVVPILLNTPKLDSSAQEFRIQNSEFRIGLNSSSNNWEPFNSVVELPSPPDSCILTPESNSFQNQLWGLLIAHHCSSPRQWQPLEVKLLQQIAVQIAIAIGQTELYQQTQAELQQRQQAQDELKTQKEFLRNVIDTNPNLICVKDWKGRFRLVNQALADIYGTTIENLIGKTDADFNANQAEVQHYLHDDRQVITSQQPKFIPEEILTSPNGQVHYLQTIKKPLLSSDGQTCYVLATATDITERKRAEQERNKAIVARQRAATERHRAAIERQRAAIERQRAAIERHRLFFELQRQNRILEAKVRERTEELSVANQELQQEVAERKQAEEALRESEEQFRQLAENIQSVFWMNDVDMTQAIYVSPAYEKIWGRPCVQLYASPKSWLDAVYPEDRDRVMALLAKQRHSEYETEYRIIRPDGKVRWIRDRSFPIRDATGQVYRVVGTAEDISEHKRVEEELRKSEERWQLVLQGNNDGIWDLNLKTNECFRSARLLEMLGYCNDELPNHNDQWTRRIHPDDFERVMQANQDYLEKKIPYYAVEYRLQCKDGSYKWVLGRAQAVWDEAGNAVRMVGSVTDSSDAYRQAEQRKQAEEALRDSEQQFRQIFQDASIGMALADFQTHRFIQVNPAWCQLLRYSPSELASLTFDQISHPDDLPDDLHCLEQSRHGKLDSYCLEKRYFKKNGELMRAKLTVTILTEQDGKPRFSLAMVEDITEQRQAEDQLRAALLEKETLIKEIHHRVKNNLQVISSLLRLQSRQIRDRQTLELFKESQNRIQAMALIHEKLYQSSNLAQIDFREYITTLVGNLCRSYDIHRRAITFKINVEQVSLAIDTAISCGLIINELVTNSLKYAFDEFQGGELCITLQCDGSPLSVSGDTKRFFLSVSDNGLGLPEDLDFRNTSSLGLQLVCRLTKQLGASIELNRSQGTNFKIVFTKPNYT